MDSVIEKLGFFDFFNYIIVGMFTIVGCFSITYQFGWETSDKIFSYLTNTVEVNTVFLVLCFFSLVTVSYIIGLLCHEIYSLIDRAVKPLNIFKKLIKNLFNDNSCIENKIKRERYTIIAKAIFEKNGIEYPWDLDIHSSKKLSLELNNYFFTYCLYQLQIRGLNRKTEKLRDIEGLAKSFYSPIVELNPALMRNILFLLICRRKRRAKEKVKERLLIERLTSLKTPVCLYIRNFAVPFDNNLSLCGMSAMSIHRPRCPAAFVLKEVCGIIWTSCHI